MFFFIMFPFILTKSSYFDERNILKIYLFAKKYIFLKSKTDFTHDGMFLKINSTAVLKVEQLLSETVSYNLLYN